MSVIFRTRVRNRFSLTGAALPAIILPAALATALPSRYTAPAGSASPPPAPTPERLERGRILFAKHCASCHGPTGAGDGTAAHDLDPQPTNLRDPDIADKPNTKLFRQITRGRAPMPSFGRLLNDDDCWTLVTFVKTLSKSDPKPHH
jgi:mono/diheme cytochrome c family protein